jgi:hypothetical protein
MKIPSIAFGRGIQAAAVFSFYLGVAVYLTWPLVTDLGGSVYLFQSVFSSGGGDLTGSIAHLRELIEGHHNPFAPGRVEDFNAPDGLEIRWALNLANFPSVILLYLMALLVGPTAAHGIFILLGYAVSGLAMFLFVRRITAHVWISLLAGWAFAFYPFAVVTTEHPGFVHGWPFVLIAWRVLEVWEKPTLVNGLWAGAAFVLAVSWTPHYFVLGGVIYGVLTVAALAGAARRSMLKRHLAAHAGGAGIALGFVLVLTALVNMSHSGETLPVSALLDVTQTSAHPLMYLIPSAHTFVGEWTRPLLDDRNWLGVERTLYVGWTIILLGLVGLGAALTQRLRAIEFRAAVLAGLMAITSVLFAAPPEVHFLGATIRFPAWFVFEVTPGVRLLSRFVIPLMAGLCILCALGLIALVRAVPARAAIAVLASATVLLPLDLWNRFPDRVYKYSTPSIYAELPSRPQGNLAEYPVRPVTAVGDYLDLYYQDVHGLPILNGYYRGPEQRRALAFAGLDDPRTPGALAALGVRYVLVTPHRIVRRVGVPSPGRPGKGFERIASDSYGTLYRVTAPPTPFAYQRDGFWGAEGPRANPYQWAGVGPVRLEVFGPCSPCSGKLEFTTASFGQPRVVTLIENGRELDIVPVGTSPQLVSVPLQFNRRTLVELRITPGPQVIDEATGSGDDRAISIFVEGPRFVPNRGR